MRLRASVNDLMALTLIHLSLLPHVSENIWKVEGEYSILGNAVILPKSF